MFYWNSKSKWKTTLLTLFLEFGIICGNASNETLDDTDYEELNFLYPPSEMEGTYGESGSSANEKRLIHHLLDRYETNEMPRLKLSSPLKIKIGLSLVAIMAVIEDGNAIQTNVILHLNYNDTNMRWNASEFGNVSTLHIRIHHASGRRIWSPDIRVLNQYGDASVSIDPTMTIVKNDGSVTQNCPGMFTTNCVMSVVDYPFQEYKCEIKIGSWSHDATQLDWELMEETGNNMKKFTDSVNWNVISFSGGKTALRKRWNAEPFVQITYVLEIQRKGMPVLNAAYTANFVICSIILLSALLPPSSGHKVTLGIFGIFLGVGSVLNFNPFNYNGEPPRLVLHFRRLLLVILSCFVSNVVIVYLFQRKGLVPSWIKYLVEEKRFWILNSFCQSELEGSTEIEMENQIPRTSTSDGQRKLSGCRKDWQFVAIILDRFQFCFWSLFILIFITASFPSF